MSIFQRWFGANRPKFHPDAFTLTRAGKYATLGNWIRDLGGRNYRVIVLCHFPSTFLEVQEALEEFDLDHDVLAHKVNEDQLLAHVNKPMFVTTITMAPMLQPAGPVVRDARGRDESIALIAVERHPLATCDQRLAQFVRNLNTDVALGYLLSFEDPVIRHFLGSTFIELMQQLGLGANDLISSAMTGKALKRAVRRSTAHVTNEIPADSPEQWLALNVNAASPGDAE